MRLLLDTHAFLWFVLNDPQLSPTAAALIDAARRACGDWLDVFDNEHEWYLWTIRPQQRQ